MEDNLFSNKRSNLFNQDVLIQLKKDGNALKEVDHLDKGKDSLDVHVVHKISKNGIYKGYDFGE